MKVFIISILSIYLLFSQGKTHSHPFNHDFDFWIGKWETEMSNAPNWQVKKGVDEVRLLLNGRLIEEVFQKTEQGNFQRGYLTFVARKKLWKHTIYDVKWGEYTFWGSAKNGEMVLTSDPHHDRPGIRRETFYNIREDSFDYKWETSPDGKNFTVVWKVHYKRIKS